MRDFVEINENELLNTNEIMHDYEFFYKLYVLNEQFDFTTKNYTVSE